MPEPTLQQKRLAKRIINVAENEELGLIDEIDNLEEKFDENYKILDNKIESVLTIIDGIQKMPGEKGDIPVAGIDYPIPKDGDNYNLTDDDKTEIALQASMLVEVSIVEKIIERVEVIKEQPIVTEIINNVIKEVAISDTPEITVAKLNTLDNALKGKVIEGWDDLNRIVKENVSLPVTTSFFNGLRAKNLNIVGGTATQSGDTVNVTVTSGGGTPGGNDTEVQFNDGGSFGGDTAFTYNKTTDTITIGSLSLNTNTLSSSEAIVIEPAINEDLSLSVSGTGTIQINTSVGSANLIPPSGSQSYTFPNASGTIALTSDLPVPGWTISTPTGALYNQDTGTGGLSFTSVGTAVAVFADGATYFNGAGCTISGTSITMDNPVTQFIRVATT